MELQSEGAGGEGVACGRVAPAALTGWFGATREHPGAVVRYQVDPDELLELHRSDWVRPEERVPRSPTPEESAWIQMLGPHFEEGRSLNFTGTYSDAYGYANGLMLPRNVERDFRSFLAKLGRSSESYLLGVEHHRSYRKILHLHAVVAGDWTENELERASVEWELFRGWCRSKHVNERVGAVRYALKHAMKQGGVDLLYFQLPRPKRFVSVTESRRKRSAFRNGCPHGQVGCTSP